MHFSKMTQLWFKSEKFEIEDGEDSETNPFCFGRQLATWLSEQLATLGYETGVIAEDWGWCVMCSRKPFLLWVGCSNIHGLEETPEHLPNKSDVVWSCFVEAEVGLLDRLLQRHETKPIVAKLFTDVQHLLSSVAAVHFVEEP